MFERPHHQRIARVLSHLDAALLRQHQCLFGGGTAIALRHGEYRESVDIGFLVSDAAHYRALRHLLTGIDGLRPILKPGQPGFEQVGDIRADQYGIRTRLAVDGQPIKFEIVREARIALEPPGAHDQVCGVACLTPLDMAASKLLANSDRWRDDGVFGRDLIDLAMMQPALPLLRAAVVKAEDAYGASVLRDLARAIDGMQARKGWLAQCMQAMKMEQPAALVWQRLPKGAPAG
jgi:hypothetical protein